ncbi:MAG: phosphate ABC transporter permease subunit PstC [bacterium]|nr:phosphate ABC transporter permease subunit PstC [bacterium]
MSVATSPTTDADVVAKKTSPGNIGNRVFEGLSASAGWVIMLTLAAVGVFLMMRAGSAFTATSEELEGVTLLRGRGLWEYIAALLFGTVMASLIALTIALPLSIGIALFISHYAPRKLAQGLGYMVDLLAAIPSVVYGLWGASWLAVQLDPLFRFLTNWLGWIPFFADYQPPARNLMTASLVLAVMILPIITATIREVFLQTPRLHEEASLALGATRWEMVKMAVFPFARSGIISSSMLGLGRALGETMAVLMIISPGFLMNFFLLKPGQHQTIAANIAAQFREASGLGADVLFATGLVLFVMTFVVNSIARAIIARRAEFSGAN